MGGGATAFATCLSYRGPYKSLRFTQKKGRPSSDWSGSEQTDSDKLAQCFNIP